jgi:hypothetical protein
MRPSAGCQYPRGDGSGDSNSEPPCSSARGQGSGGPLTCDSSERIVTARGRRCPPVPDVVRTQCSGVRSQGCGAGEPGMLRRATGGRVRVLGEAHPAATTCLGGTAARQQWQPFDDARQPCRIRQTGGVAIRIGGPAAGLMVAITRPNGPTTGEDHQASSAQGRSSDRRTGAVRDGIPAATAVLPAVW